MAAAGHASEARADVASGFAASGLGIGGALVLTDLGFLAYDAIVVEDDNEPIEGVMIAQTAVWAPQMAVTNALMIWGQIDREHGALFTLAGLVPAAFTTGMTTFGAWSLANQSVDVASRFGVSFMIGANFALTAGAVTSAFVHDHVASPYLAIPEIVIGSVQAVPSFVQAARDPDHRAAWLGLGAWSTVLAIHGAVSAGVWSTATEPAKDADDPERPPTGVSWTIAPTVYTEGARSLPGLMAAGAF